MSTSHYLFFTSDLTKSTIRYFCETRRLVYNNDQTMQTHLGGFGGTGSGGRGTRFSMFSLWKRTLRLERDMSTFLLLFPRWMWLNPHFATTVYLWPWYWYAAPESLGSWKKKLKTFAAKPFLLPWGRPISVSFLICTSGKLIITVFPITGLPWGRVWCDLLDSRPPEQKAFAFLSYQYLKTFDPPAPFLLKIHEGIC